MGAYESEIVYFFLPLKAPILLQTAHAPQSEWTSRRTENPYSLWEYTTAVES